MPDTNPTRTCQVRETSLRFFNRHISLSSNKLSEAQPAKEWTTWGSDCTPSTFMDGTVLRSMASAAPELCSRLLPQGIRAYSIWMHLQHYIGWRPCRLKRGLCIARSIKATFRWPSSTGTFLAQKQKKSP